MAEYIEREVVEKMLESAQIITDEEYAGYCMDDISIYRIPSADVAPVVHGRWLWDTGDIWTCSVCGTRNHIKEVMGRPDFNYCPDCGALMNKEAPNGD